MPRIGGIAAAANRARQAKALASAQAKKKRSSNAATLIELHREFFESLSPKQYEKLYSAFLSHGKAEPGFITAKELGPLLKSLGDEPRSRELQDLISLVDADGNALVDFTEFLTLVAVRSQHTQSEADLLEAFRLFDTDGNGTMQVSVFRQAMTQLCGLSPEETESMVAEALEITRQHEARQRELDGARHERRLQRKLPRARVVDEEGGGPLTGDSPAGVRGRSPESRGSPEAASPAAVASAASASGGVGWGRRGGAAPPPDYERAAAVGGAASSPAAAGPLLAEDGVLQPRAVPLPVKPPPGAAVALPLRDVIYYVAHWMMANLALAEGDIVVLRNMQLPKAQFVRFRPHSKDFLDITDHKAVLERQLSRFSALTKGDVVCFRYADRNHYMDVLELKPADACSIIETDCSVDFAPPVDYVEPPRKPPPAAAAASAGGHRAPGGGAGTAESPFMLDDDDAPPPGGAAGGRASSGGGEAAYKRMRAVGSSPLVAAAAVAASPGLGPVAGGFPPPLSLAGGGASPKLGGASAPPASPGIMPFSGAGRRLADSGGGGVSESKSGGGGGLSPSLSPSLTPAAGGVLLSGTSQAAGRPQRTLNRFEQARAAKAFQGQGKSLRD